AVRARPLSGGAPGVAGRRLPLESAVGVGGQGRGAGERWHPPGAHDAAMRPPGSGNRSRTLRLMAGLSLWLLVGCDVRIHHGLEEREANELVAALQTVGITAQKVAESGRGKTWAVQVPADVQALAVQQLNALG